MALVLLRFSINNQAGNGRIINTNNIESIFKLGDMADPKFKTGKWLILTKFTITVIL